MEDFNHTKIQQNLCFRELERERERDKDSLIAMQRMPVRLTIE